MLAWLLLLLVQNCFSATCNIEDNVVNNYNIEENLIANNWTRCYLSPYNAELSINTLLSSCPTGNDYYLFFGALATSTSFTVYVGAMGPSSVLNGYTSSYNYAYKPEAFSTQNPSYNVYWYNYPSKLFGFAPITTIDLQYCRFTYSGCQYHYDYYDSNDVERMSWAVDQSATGGRAGAFLLCAGISDISDCGAGNAIWHQVVYYKYCGPTDAPTSSPSPAPTDNPTIIPTKSPTYSTYIPTLSPTIPPTQSPTFSSINLAPPPQSQQT